MYRICWSLALEDLSAAGMKDLYTLNDVKKILETPAARNIGWYAISEKGVLYDPHDRRGRFIDISVNSMSPGLREKMSAEILAARTPRFPPAFQAPPRTTCLPPAVPAVRLTDG
jgi:hypothetical protein